MKSQFLIAVAALALTACSMTPTVRQSAPHGVIYLQQHHAADDTYPVAVVAIDGVTLQVPFDARGLHDDTHDLERYFYRLAPGRHTVTLIADLEGTRQPFARLQRNLMPYAMTIEIEIEDGKQYTLAGVHHGPSLRDWEPVLKNVRDLR